MTVRTRFGIALTAPVIIAFVVAPTPGQTSRVRTESAKETTEAAKSKNAANQAKVAAAARKIRALQLLDEVLSDAKLVDDLRDRALIQARAAQVLWATDHDRSRRAFRQAWDSATAEDREQRRAAMAPNAPADDDDEDDGAAVRDEIMSMTARYDTALAEEFLHELLKDNEETAGNKLGKDPANEPADPWRQPSPEAEYRLMLAGEQLRAGDPARAIQLAAPVIAEGVSGDLVEFLLLLWNADAAGAERLYAALIERVANDPNAGPVEVLLLSAPVVSPELLVTVDANGALLFRPMPPLRAPLTVSAPTRHAFLISAAEILLRPMVPVGDSGLTPDAVARYYTGGRLLPLLETEAPESAEAVRLRNNALANEIDSTRRDILSGQMTASGYPVNRAPDPLRDQSDYLEKARTPEERDGILLNVVWAAVQHRIWDRAKRFAGDITDVDSRRAALGFIELGQIADLMPTFENDKDTDLVALATFVRKADVPPLATAWGLAQVALIARKQNKIASANALFTEAAGFAGKTASGSDQRIAAYLTLALLGLNFNQTRAWLVVPDLVQAANADADYRGDVLAIGIGPVVAPTENLAKLFKIYPPAFRLDQLFTALAKLDFDRAADLARTFGNRLPKIDAMLAVARVAFQP